MIGAPNTRGQKYWVGIVQWAPATSVSEEIVDIFTNYNTDYYYYYYYIILLLFITLLLLLLLFYYYYFHMFFFKCITWMKNFAFEIKSH